MNKLLILLGFFALAGCETGNESGETYDGTPYVKSGAAGYSMYLTEVELSDGTRCVIAQGYKSGGITCDWD
jgi:hypothetical protein